jgi:hypothetical protein
MFSGQQAGIVDCWATLGKHCLKAGIVEPDKELFILLMQLFMNIYETMHS